MTLVIKKLTFYSFKLDISGNDVCQNSLYLQFIQSLSLKQAEFIQSLSLKQAEFIQSLSLKQAEFIQSLSLKQAEFIQKS